MVVPTHTGVVAVGDIDVGSLFTSIDVVPTLEPAQPGAVAVSVTAPSFAATAEGMDVLAAVASAIPVVAPVHAST
jgi:hypothetical protein